MGNIIWKRYVAVDLKEYLPINATTRDAFNLHRANKHKYLVDGEMNVGLQYPCLSAVEVQPELAF